MLSSVAYVRSFKKVQFSQRNPHVTHVLLEHVRVLPERYDRLALSSTTRLLAWARVVKFCAKEAFVFTRASVFSCAFYTT